MQSDVTQILMTLIQGLHVKHTTTTALALWLLLSMPRH
jgi:hypothetical protein